MKAALSADCLHFVGALQWKYFGQSLMRPLSVFTDLFKNVFLLKVEPNVAFIKLKDATVSLLKL